MTKRDQLTEREFDELLAWLDSSRDSAGEKYEIIRRGLIEMFRCRCCWEPEDLADQTINRVARKVKEIAETYSGDPARYFYGVAKKVLLEDVRRNVKQQAGKQLINQRSQPGVDETEDLEQQHQCLGDCLETLGPDSRDLIILYYSMDKQAGRDNRKELCRRLGMKPVALRVRVYRIRETLASCVRRCLDMAVTRN